MKNRPNFTKNMSKEEFMQHYWYKTELQAICAKFDLPTVGTKAELQVFLLDFLDGKEPINSRKHINRLRLNKSLNEISLDTKLIEDGFKFDNNARQFFADFFKVKKFSFTKDMAAALRKAEKENDKTMCVKDLIEIYIDSKYNKKSSKSITTQEDLTYQWNNFLKDFHADPATKDFRNKLLVASFLWKNVRDNPGKKIYSSDLLDKYAQQIKETCSIEKHISQKIF